MCSKCITLLYSMFYHYSEQTEHDTTLNAGYMHHLPDLH